MTAFSFPGAHVPGDKPHPQAKAPRLDTGGFCLPAERSQRHIIMSIATLPDCERNREHLKTRLTQAAHRADILPL